MDDRPLAPEERYARIVAALLGSPDVSQSTQKGFGASGLMIRGKLFATLRRDELLLKLPKARVATLIATGNGKPFDRGQGRPMKEWLTVPQHSQEDWLALAREAMAFVAAAP